MQINLNYQIFQGELLIEVQSNVVDKFLKSIMAQKVKKTLPVIKKEQEKNQEDETTKEDEGVFDRLNT